MNARVIAVVNQKGGSGKTTTTQMLAAALSVYHSKKVLALDIDPQGSLTIAAGMDGKDLPEFYLAMASGTYLQALTTGVGSGYDLIAGGKLTGELERNTNSIEHIRIMLDIALPVYDYILIDCSPSLSVLTLNALAAADEVIITTLPHYLNIAGVEQLLDTLDTLQARGLGVERARILFTQTDNTKLAKETIEATRETYPDVFNTVIRRNVALAEAQSNGLDIYQFNKSSNGAKDYRALADEIVRG